MTTLASYFDESSDDIVFSIAGYVSDYATWCHLDWSWRDLLKKWDVAYFKASECETLVGEFLKHRTDPEHPRAPMTQHDKDVARYIRTDFIDAICKSETAIFGVGNALIKADFEKIIGENEKALHLFGTDPYFVCLQVCLTRMVKKLRDDNGPIAGKHWVKPIFDSHEKVSGMAKIVYDKFRQKNPDVSAVLLPLDYQSDIETPALQAADLLVYEVRKYLIGQQFDNRPPRKSWERLSPTIYAVDRLDYAQFARILELQGKQNETRS